MLNYSKNTKNYKEFRQLLDSSFMSDNLQNKANRSIEDLKQKNYTTEEIITQFRVLLADAGISKFACITAEVASGNITWHKKQMA